MRKPVNMSAAQAAGMASAFWTGYQAGLWSAVFQFNQMSNYSIHW
jgi:hypothetical protein